MTVFWKLQHYNNSCASACMAMLLSRYNIDKQDADVIVESGMPYLVRLNEDGSFSAGALVQDKETFDTMLTAYGLELVENRHSDWPSFIGNADDLLQSGTPFMTGILRPNQSGSHAVVFYEKDGEDYLFLDPDAGLDRTREHRYEDVREQVTGRFSRSRFREAANSRHVIGYLAKTSKNPPDLRTALQRSIDAMNVYREAVEKRLAGMETPDYESFFRFIIDIVKPIALDLCTAIQVSGTNPELVHTLTQYRNEVIAIQRQIKSCEIEDWEFAREELTDNASVVHSAVIEHIEDNL